MKSHRLRRLIRPLLRAYDATLPYLGLTAFLLGIVAGILTAVGQLPPIVGGDKLWPRISNSLLWFLVASEGFDYLGDWLEDEADP